MIFQKSVFGYKIRKKDGCFIRNTTGDKKLIDKDIAEYVNKHKDKYIYIVHRPTANEWSTLVENIFNCPKETLDEIELRLLDSPMEMSLLDECINIPKK